MSKKTIYRFFLAGRWNEAVEYDADEWDKEEMNYDVCYNLFPHHCFCVRQKLVDDVMEYSNLFILDKRRASYEQGKIYINNYRLHEKYDNN